MGGMIDIIETEAVLGKMRGNEMVKRCTNRRDDQYH